MNKYKGFLKMFFIAFLLMAIFMAGCGGNGGNQAGALSGVSQGEDAGPVGDSSVPTVTATDPANIATGVATNKKVAATFSKTMDPSTINTTTFIMTGPDLAPVSGTVNYVGLIGTFTPASDLAINTTYTATVTTGATGGTGVNNLDDRCPLAENYTWSFTTGAGPDLTAPEVTATDPANGDIGVAINKKIAATFSKGMDPETINTTTFTLRGPLLPVTGTVTYVGQIATFTPSSNLAVSTTYTATITNGAKDLAGNALAANYTWTFTTGEVPDTTPPTVILTNPANGDTDVPINVQLKATFSKGMDPTTITDTTFKVTGVPGTVTYNAVTKIATLTLSANLATNTPYTATITTGVKDLAGNAMAANYVWNFTTGIRTLAQPIALNAAETFGCFGGGAGMTNQGLLTVINGDIGTTGVSTLITGFRDKGGHVFTVTPLNNGYVNGIIYASDTVPPAGTDGALAARTAYNSMTPASLPGGVDLGTDQLGGLTLKPGIYKSAGGSYQITGVDLILDAQGDPNAVWVFQMASSLTVGGPGAPRSVILLNEAQPKNVFWQVGSAATINGAGGGTMVGTIIAEAGVTFSTADNVDIVTLNGRALGLNASVTLVNTIINVPAP